LAKIEQDSSPKAQVKSSPKDTVVETKLKKIQKLSYNQERLLKVLPEEIKELEKEIANLVAELSNPDLYQNNPQRFDEASSALAAKQQEKSAKEEQWLEIEILKEQFSA
jgi:ATP-binding cassette subfamily F protein uup